MRLEKGVAMSEGAAVAGQVYAGQLVGSRWPTQVGPGSAIVIVVARRRGRGIHYAKFFEVSP